MHKIYVLKKAPTYIYVLFYSIKYSIIPQYFLENWYADQDYDMIHSMCKKLYRYADQESTIMLKK